MRALGPILLASTLAACTTSPPQMMERNARAEARLQEELAGLVVTGQPTSCIPNWRADQMIVIDDDTILFRDGPNRIWRNETRGNCNMLDRGYTLVIRQTGSQLCSGEIGQVVDLQSGVSGGSCVLGEFVAYNRP